jgi:cysteine-rich repeat protein
MQRSRMMLWAGIAGFVLTSRISTAHAQEGCSLPPLPVPCEGSDVTVSKRGGTPLAPGTYGSVRVKNGGTLVLTGDAYVFCGDLHVARNGSLLASVPTSIQVGGNVMFANATVVGPVAEDSVTPCDVDLFVAGDTVSIQRNADVRLELCAPNAELHVNNGATLIGDFVAHDTHIHRVTLGPCPEMPTTTTLGPTTTTSTIATTTSSSSTTASSTSTTSTTVGSTSTTSTTTVPTSTSTTVSSTSSTSTSSTTGTLATTTTSTVTTTSATTLSSTTSTTAATTSSTTTSSSTATTAIPTTTTSSTTTTTMAASLCGNGVIEGTETCDDGNTVDENTVDPLPPDACPANCRIESCNSTSATFAVTVNFSSSASIAGYKVFVDYPEGKVVVPGTGAQCSNQAGCVVQNDPTNGAIGNDLDYGIIVVGSGISAIPAPRLFTLNFTSCGTAPTAAEFNCKVHQASDTNGNDVPMTCSVSIP